MGMRLMNVQMKTTVKVSDLLARLIENREKHAKIVEEANAGYLVAASKKAMDAVEAFRAGKVDSLQNYVLRVPEDYTSAYDSCIEMLRWSQEETITLAADEFRQFVQDQWDWKDGFIAGNAAYSQTARLGM